MPEDPKKTTESKTLEHPITELDAKKYAGQGDFNLPVSPLDQLVEAAPTAAQQATAPPAMSPTKSSGPATPVVDPSLVNPVSVMKPTKADTMVAAQQPVPGASLESQAKNMLKELDKTAQPKKKKRRSGTAAKMALAAVLVVMMGAGGMVGMNLLKLQQVGDPRSQASCTCTDGTRNYAPGKWGCNGTTTYRICEESAHGCRWSEQISNCPTNQTCQTDEGVPEGKCVASAGNAGTCGTPFFCVTQKAGATCNGGAGVNTVVDSDGRCCVVREENNCQDGRTCVSSCTSAGGGGSGNLPYSCDDTGCRSTNTAQCLIFYYYSPNPAEPVVGVDNCVVDPTEGDVTTIVCRGASATFNSDCGAHQIDVACNDGAGGPMQSVDNRSRRETDDCGEPPGGGDTPSYSCTSLQSSIAAPTLNQTITLTCNAAANNLTINHYEYRYKVGAGEYASLTGSGSTTQLKVDRVGKYTVQCRACKSTTECTAWGQAQ